MSASHIGFKQFPIQSQPDRTLPATEPWTHSHDVKSFRLLWPLVATFMPAAPELSIEQVNTSRSLAVRLNY